MIHKQWDSIQAMTEAIVSDFRNYESTGVKAWDSHIALQDLAYQAGGLQKLGMQLRNERHSEGLSREEILKKIETELSEVIAVSLFIAHDLGLDVTNGFQNMLKTDEKKIQERRQNPIK